MGKPDSSNKIRYSKRVFTQLSLSPLSCLVLVRPFENRAVLHGCTVRLELHSHQREDRNNLRLRQRLECGQGKTMIVCNNV